ncbi:hypothetical protein J8J14_18195 [Roseomonas sp. SSH11]|uniref:Uncharacterized protein n=1 Tax=Pararoseomonas baculiformis TaxID=2820812 RepID=A0ABS4AIL7_9PROT|nr:hypothetical protein [Pararoseomonas baculiformis]MBP0446711.1 hypothetical protein [Pararoseomonas baculiformis]
MTSTRMSEASWNALLAEAAAGNASAAQAIAAEVKARGEFAHIDTPEGRASFAEMQARLASPPDRTALSVVAAMHGDTRRVRR